MLALLIAMPMSAGFAAPAFAAPGEFLQITKSVDSPELAPGDSFTYRVQVTCSEADCVDASLVDPLPAELAGFPVQAVQFTPSESSLPRSVTWTTDAGTSVTPPGTVDGASAVSINFEQPVGAGDSAGLGLEAGQTFTMLLTLKVPENYPPGTSGDIVNTATTQAENALVRSADATIVIDSAIEVGIDVTKSWSPASQAFAVGAPSAIALAATNTSNVAAAELAIQEPKAAPGGAATLDASNPFTVATFTGFTNTAVPTVCVTSQVDAYVLTGDTWNWVSGEATTPPSLELPAGVTNADVGGIRVTCIGELPTSATVELELGLTQRADLNFGEYRVDNIATGEVTVPEHEPVTDDASASHLITPIKPTVEAAKNISPARIAAGQTATAAIGATNGAIPVASMSLSDPGFFTDNVTFDGWDGGITYPPGATSGTVEYALAAGGTDTVPFASGDVPTAPSDAISGFELHFTGAIEAAATVNAKFSIATTEDATGTELETTLTNRVIATVVDVNRQEAEADAADTLTIIAPGIETTLDKRVRPSAPVAPGESAFVSLDATATAMTETSTVHDIIIEDTWNGNVDGFWNAFHPAALAPTQIPGGTSLTVEVFDGTDWHTISTEADEADARVVQLSAAEFRSALGAENLETSEVTGIRFSFHNADGFAQNTTVSPLIVFIAQDTTRDGSPTTQETDNPTGYENAATVVAEGVSEGGAELGAEDGDTGTGTIVTTPGGPGPVGIDKGWLKQAVSAQSGERASTRLFWNVTPGFDSVVITDPKGDFADVSDTVFDTFDLVGISPIVASSDPFSNGWYLRYDTITSIDLWSAAAGDWVQVAAPAAGWINNGAFAGLQLTPEQTADTLGVRIALAENIAARDAALLPGSTFDPFAPAPGTGVGAGSVDRAFTLDWELRDKNRSGGDWVTAKSNYNTTDAGVVNNTTALEATPASGSPARDTGADTILIVDQLPGVTVEKKTSATDDVFVPPVGTPADDYPTVSWTVTANNNSVAPASYLRVTDPANCVGTALSACQLAGPNADPFTDGVEWVASPGGLANPFDRFDLTGIDFSASIPAEVSLGDSVVWLLRYDSATKTTTTEQSTASVVAALTATELTDVIGVSVTFQPADAGADGVGGTITQANKLTVNFDSILRETIRSTGIAQSLRAGETVDVTNRAFAQSYDPVLSPGVQTGDADDATATLTGGIINIAPTKTVAPDQIVIANPDVPVTVTLGANQGSDPRSTLSPSVVTIEDQADSPEFWDTFDFTGLATIVLPAGATQVQVDAYGPFSTGGAPVWVEGSPSATGTMPVGAEDYPDIQGIRFVFTNGDDGAFFSPTVPAPNWSTTAAFTAQLRDTYRSSGDDVVFDGTVTNSQTSMAARTDGNNSVARVAAELVTLDLGTQELAVNKLTNGGNRIASVGDNVPFRLTVENTGTGYLTLDSVTDELPAELVWLGTEAAEYTAAAGGTLSTDVTLALADDGRTMTFTWPDGGKTMQPGEVFTIDLKLELQPGLAPGASATNTMTATTAEVLDRCENTNAPQQGTTDAWVGSPTTCGTTDDVRAVSGPNLFTVKGVSGSVEGASVPGRPDITCAPTLAVGADSYYRTPCIANSVVGGVDDWVLRAANAGTFTVQNMVIFDQLPTPGDQSLISGSERGSQFRPELVAESIDVSAPAGTATVVEVTTSENVCRGTWTNLTGQGPCEQAGETWAAVDSSTDWTAVSGIRVSLDFASLAGGGLVGGQIVDVTFSTRNVLASADSPLGASITVPAADEIAINQHGVKYTDQGGVKKIAPATVGVQLLTGSIEVRKDITGAAAGYAPDAFTATVECRVGDVELDLADNSTVTMSDANGYTVRIDGIPYSIETPPECTIAESGNPGEFGESSRSIDPAGGVIVIREPSTASDVEVPAAQVATITNDYRYSGLSVTKTVATEATEGEFGPFTFTLSCLTPTGVPVTFDDNDQTLLEFVLNDGGTFTAPENRIPARAECTLTETDGFFADTIAIVGDNTTDNGDASATIVVGDEASEVIVTNGYEAGTLTVAKIVEGEGADSYGSGPFSFAATCTYQGQELLNTEFQLERDGTRSFGVYPYGTECSVAETSAGGATDTAITPTDGTVVIPAAEGDENVGAITVTATNTFDIGSVDVVKNVVGEGAELYGAGPFTAQVVCSWDREGTTTAVELAADGIITLAESNDYRATVDGVIVGAECAVAETDAAGATSTTVEPENGAVTIPAAGADAPLVTITNTFDVTSIDVTKVVQGNLAAAGASGPFEVELACSWPVSGVDTDVEIPGGATRELSNENRYAESYELLPVGSACSITETEFGGADDTAITVLVDGSDRTDITGVTAGVDISATSGPGQARVIVTNAFDEVVVLPRTGADVTFIGVLMISLLGGGAVLLLASRKRRHPRQR